jgi:hypothetical protein
MKWRSAARRPAAGGAMLLTLIASGVAPWWLSGEVVTLGRVAIEAPAPRLRRQP